MIKKIYLYIAKKFLLTTFLIVMSLSALVAIINIFEIIDKANNVQISFWQIISLDLLQIPSFLESISTFLIMLSAMITLFYLSSRSEITVMRSSGLSFSQIVMPIAFTSFLIGIFCLLVFNPLSILASKEFTKMEQILIKKERNNLLAPAGGIWLKQTDSLQTGEEIIIRAEKIYKKNLKMKNVNFWLFDKNQKFYKKIDAKYATLKEEYWDLDSVIINDQNNLNKNLPTFAIPTNLKEAFIRKKVLNNFEDVRLFSIYDLPMLIDDLRESGFSSRKFLVYYYSLLCKPILFAAVSLIASFFVVNNVRGRNNIFLFGCGIVVGLVFYIGLIVTYSFGSSGAIPAFLSTWMMAIILLAIAILTILKKEGSY